MEAMKEGLIEKSPVGPIGKEHKREGAEQLPKKETETVKKDGKTFKIK